MGGGRQVLLGWSRKILCLLIVAVAGCGGSAPGGSGRVNLPERVTIDLGGGVTLELALIRPGTFLMGSPKGEEGRSEDEKQHQVILTTPSYEEYVMDERGVQDPTGGGSGDLHALRGGSWSGDTKSCRAAVRDCAGASSR